MCLPYVFIISEDKPSSIFFLVLQIMPRYFDTHNAISVVAGHKITASWWSSCNCLKWGIRAEILPRKQFLFNKRELHAKIACFSSSTELLLQYLQVLEERGVIGRVYLPDSIRRLDTALTLKRVSQAR